MPPGEIARRVAFAGRKASWRSRKDWQAPAARIAVSDPWALEIEPDACKQDVERVLEEALSVAGGSFSLLNFLFETTDPDWHFDPQLNIRSPLRFGPDIDYRDRSIAGNVKNIWELNRHQYLCVVALAYAISGDRRFAELVCTQLEAWVRENPTLKGVNWHSSLELGVRLLSWVWIERLLRGSDEHGQLFGDNGVLWSPVYWHQWMIRRQLSRGSSSNNHLTGELVWLFVASTVWPYFDESPDWERTARRELEREVSRQTFSSGLNREQAFSYHLFSLELFLVAGIEAERLNQPFSDSYKDVVRQMAEVIPILTDVGGNLPQYGDADGGVAVQLSSQQSSRLDFLYRVTADWLGARVPVSADNAGKLAADIAWPSVSNDEDRRFVPPSRSHAFDDAGLYVLTTNRNSTKELFCLADAGPLGFLSIAAHGHADSLSFTLSAGGQPILIDPGTFSYFLDPDWRQYFRSTKAHNTITIDGQDQSVSGGPFMWMLKAETEVLDWRPEAENPCLSARHEGYKRLDHPVVHERQLILDGGGLDVNDKIQGTGTHELEWRLHFHPSCDVSINSDTCIVTWRGGCLELHLDKRLDWSLVTAKDDAGWYSAGFNLKEPTTSLVGAAQVTLPLDLHHRLKATFENES
jgi:hypothetical protein